MMMPAEHAAKKVEAEQRRKAEATAKAAAKEMHRQRIVDVGHHCTLQEPRSKCADTENLIL